MRRTWPAGPAMGDRVRNLAAPRSALLSRQAAIAATESQGWRQCAGALFRSQLNSPELTENTKKGKPGQRGQASPVSDCSFPSRLRAISLDSRNVKRGKSQATPLAEQINARRKKSAQPLDMARRQKARFARCAGREAGRKRVTSRVDGGHYRQIDVSQPRQYCVWVSCSRHAVSNNREVASVRIAANIAKMPALLGGAD